MAQMCGAGNSQAAAILWSHVNGHLPWRQRAAREVEVYLVVPVAHCRQEHHVKEVLLATP